MASFHEMKDDIIRETEKIVKDHKGNVLEEIGDPIYDTPIVGFSSALDPMFEDLKKIVGLEHFTPSEIYRLRFGEELCDGTVISVVLPLGNGVRESNRTKEAPSKEWMISRTFSDTFLKDISSGIESYLEGRGYNTVTPMLSPWYKKYDTPKGPCSVWSERHIAFVAGLGTFSLNDGFITEKGIAVRLISFVTDLVLSPDIRKAQSYNENCLYCNNGSCGVCIKRCPVGAISERGHDKIRCMEFVYSDRSELLLEYGLRNNSVPGCGLCQTGVPCEFKNPLKRC
jgi:Uncharacterized Fe-S protein